MKEAFELGLAGLYNTALRPEGVTQEVKRTMLQRTRTALLVGLALIAGIMLAGCGGGGGSNAVGDLPAESGTVTVALGDLGGLRQASPSLRAEVVVWGPGMANAAKDSVALAATTTPVVTFQGVPEGQKFVSASIWDDTAVVVSTTRAENRTAGGHLIGMGYAGLEVRPGQPNQTTVPVVSPVLQQSETVTGTRDLGAGSTRVLQVLDVDTGNVLRELFYGAGPAGLTIDGFAEPQSGVRQAGTVPVAFSPPIRLLPTDAYPGYRREFSSTMVLPDPSTGALAGAPIIGQVDGLCEYRGVHGVSVPAGDFANASLVVLRMQGGSDPGAPLSIEIDLEQQLYLVEGTGPVLEQIMDATQGRQEFSWRSLTDTGVAAPASTTRTSVAPYPLSNLLYPLDLGRFWNWAEVHYGDSPPPTT